MEMFSMKRNTIVIAALLPSAVFGIWVWQEVNERAVIQAGAYIAALSVGLILFSAIKTKPADKAAVP